MVFLVLLLSGILVALFFTLFEQRDSERDIGLKGEAVFNPLLVAQRFLEESGIESESLVSMLKLKQMPERKDIILLTTRRYDIGAELRDKMMGWVESGGHLIIVAWPKLDKNSDLQDPFLKKLKISVNRKNNDDDDLDITTEFNCSKDQQHDTNTDDKTTDSDIASNDPASDEKNCEVSTNFDFKPIAITITSEREKSMVAFNPSIWLTTGNDDKANWVVNGENGAHLIEYVKGKGLVTVLSDYQFLTNTQLQKNDHAAFFWYLVHFSNNSGKVWIVYRGDSPPLYVWLAKHLWAPFLALFFIIAIWIWSVLPRFGAQYPIVSSYRRNLIEHIRASGQFLWKNKFSEDLIHETRNALHEKITQRHPNWNALTEMELYTRLSKQTGISLENVELAFKSTYAKKEQEFYIIIQILERLRKLI